MATWVLSRISVNFHVNLIYADLASSFKSLQIFTAKKKPSRILSFKDPGTALIETKPIQVYTNENHS